MPPKKRLLGFARSLVHRNGAQRGAHRTDVQQRQPTTRFPIGAVGECRADLVRECGTFGERMVALQDRDGPLLESCGGVLTCETREENYPCTHGPINP